MHASLVCMEKSLYKRGITLAPMLQVGKDTEAQAFLGKLDNDRDVGSMVDATSYFELEAEEYQRRGVVLTPELWMVKLMVGAIDPTYDEQVRSQTTSLSRHHLHW